MSKSKYMPDQKGEKYEKLIIRAPKWLHALLKSASYHSEYSMNKIIVEVLESRATAIEKKYCK